MCLSKADGDMEADSVKCVSVDLWQQGALYLGHRADLFRTLMFTSEGAL